MEISLLLSLPVKQPKLEAIGYLRGIVVGLGTLIQWSFNHDEVLEENDLVYIRQDCTVKYAKDQTDG